MTWLTNRRALGSLAVLLVAAAPGGRAIAEDWPGFLGPRRNGSTTNFVGLPWPAEGLRRLWSRAVGQGFSGPVLSGDHLVLFHREDGQEVVEAIQARTGKTEWRTGRATHYQDDFGFDEGPRGTPTVVDGKVYAFGAEGRLTCLNLADGRELWSVDTKSQFQSDKGFFGMAASPLVWKGLVLVNLGGRNGAAMAAFKADSGSLAWKRGDDEAGYASPVALSSPEGDVALFFTRSGLTGVKFTSGDEVFAFPWRSRQHASVNAASPLTSGDEIFLTASYQTGAALLRRRAGKLDVVWSGDESLSAHYATPVVKDGFLYGFHGRQDLSRPDFRCVEWSTGKVRWSAPALGAGTVILARDTLAILLETGELLAVAADPAEFKVKGRFQAVGSGARAPFALADKLVAARDPRRLAVFELPGPH